MQAPKVSIVIPVYNGANYLSQAIDSALSQTWKNLEVIVVNDGSNDDGATAAVARRYGDRIIYVEKENGGVSSALNEGIRRMSGEYFSWLSHDDLYLPNKIRHQMRLLRRCGDPRQIIAGGYYIVDEALNPLGLMDFYQLYPRKKLETPLFPVFHCAVNGCTLLIHKSHFERVGLFDESLPTTQDYDMWFRMLREQRLHYIHAIDIVSRAHEKQTSQLQKDYHEKECLSLWVRLIEQLSESERIQIAGSTDKFYIDLYRHFSQRTSYVKLAEYLHSKCTNDKVYKELPVQPLPIGRKKWMLRWELRYIKEYE